MHSKRIIVLLVVLGLLTTLTTSAYASPSTYPATPDIVGVWQTSIKLETLPEAFDAFWSFSGDGNFLETNVFKEVNAGVWIGSGNTYVVTWWGYVFDEQGQAIGKSKVRLSITMDGADHWTAEGEMNTYDLAGNPMENELDGPGTVEGNRVQIELP